MPPALAIPALTPPALALPALALLAPPALALLDPPALAPALLDPTASFFATTFSKYCHFSAKIRT